MSRDEAQRELDRIHGELNDLYREVREKESEADKYNRIVHPEDYDTLPDRKASFKSGLVIDA